MRPTRILLADDHLIVLDGLKEILEAEPDFQVAGQAHNGRMLWALVTELHPDLVLLDLNMPGKDGLEIIAEIKAGFPKTKVLVLTMYESPEIVRRALSSGADGYLLKDRGQETLLFAIREVLAGRQYVCERARTHSPNLSPLFQDAYAGLASVTPREKEVLRLIAQSYTNREIGAHMFLSEHTAATHRRNLKRKLHAKNTAELIRFAYDMGFITARDK
jgi:DNA-binding NarL/FixJ family response regulator